MLGNLDNSGSRSYEYLSYAHRTLCPCHGIETDSWKDRWSQSGIGYFVPTNFSFGGVELFFYVIGYFVFQQTSVLWVRNFTFYVTGYYVFQQTSVLGVWNFTFYVVFQQTSVLGVRI